MLLRFELKLKKTLSYFPRGLEALFAFIWDSFTGIDFTAGHIESIFARSLQTEG